MYPVIKAGEHFPDSLIFYRRGGKFQTLNLVFEFREKEVWHMAQFHIRKFKKYFKAGIRRTPSSRARPPPIPHSNSLTRALGFASTFITARCLKSGKETYMRLTGESMFVSARAGNKNGKDWHMAKFLDEDAEEFFTAFVDETLFEQFQTLPKHTSVILTLNLVPGQKYFSLESVEIIEN